MEKVVFRVPFGQRVGVSLGAASPIFVVVGSTIAAGVEGKLAVGAMFVAAGVIALLLTMVYRISQRSLIIDGDVLVIRNYVRNHRIPRDQIRGFSRGRPSLGRGETILVETYTRAVPVDVFAIRFELRDAAFSPEHHSRENARATLIYWSGQGPTFEVRT